MENEPPFLSSQSARPQLEPILEDSHSESFAFTIPQSLSTPLIFHEIQDQDHPQQPQPSTSAPFGPPDIWKMKLGSLHRSKTAPALAVMKDLKPKTPPVPKPQSESSTIIRQAIFLLAIYLSLGVAIYSFNTDHFSDILLSGVVNYVLDLQENMILHGIQMNKTTHEGFSATNYIVDVEKGRMRIRLKVGLALGVVVLCIGIGTLVLYFLEDLNWIDSVYLSVMSVTTVGYGDRAFKTLIGRLFAAVWLLFSTLAVARAFLYLAEARIDKRHRRIAKWVLHRDITVEDLFAADINNNGFISKSEYVIYKLKEMGKIGEKDILQICNQFSKLDPNNSGKITLPNLLANRL